jgi:hypothetical protein
MQGFKTYLVALLMGFLPAITTWVAGIDWAHLLMAWGVPQAYIVPLAGLLAAVVMAVMRAITQLTTVKEALNTEPPK